MLKKFLAVVIATTFSFSTPIFAQPIGGSGADLTNLNGSNITSGTVPAARGGAGTINGALKANGSGVVSQAACADLSNAGSGCSGTAGSVVLIQTITTTGGATTMTFSSLGSYNHLRFICNTGDTTNNSGSTSGLLIRFNGDTASNYRYQMYGSFGSNQTFETHSASDTTAYSGANANAGTTGVPFSSNIIDIIDYRGANQKFLRGQFSAIQGNVGLLQGSLGAWWTGTAAITSIVFTTSGGTFSTGSTCWLYGIT